MEASRPSPVDMSSQTPPREADLPLLATVRELFSGLRAGAADVADLVAAEARVALHLLIGIILSAVGAAMLGIFALAGVLATIATALVERGASASSALGVLTLICAVGCIFMAVKMRAFARRALFGRTRSHLRGEG
jgi:hypothetical protein